MDKGVENYPFTFANTLPFSRRIEEEMEAVSEGNDGG